MKPNWFLTQALRRKIINDPYYRFESLTEIAIARELGIKIDVNRAGVDDWLRLPGVSIHQARNLVHLVGQGVQFFSLEDLAAALSIPVSRLKPLEPILEFCYYDNQSFLTPQAVNPNTASEEQLTAIPYLDSNLIDKILENRQQQGKYRDLVDFQQRLALDSQIIAHIMHYLRF